MESKLSTDARDLSAENKRAWDSLYGSTDSLIWGVEPIGFLGDALREAVLGLPGELTALDAGTGEGRNLEPLLRVARDVHACDASLHALRKIPASLSARVQTHHCDLVRLPFDADTFDLVLAVDVIETLPAPEPVLREFVRVLQPGGVLLCNIPGPEDEIAGIEMEPLQEGQYLFQGRFFYQFLEEPKAIALLNSCGLEVRAMRLQSWPEPAHPNFRAAPHMHTSRIFIAERAP